MMYSSKDGAYDAYKDIVMMTFLGREEMVSLVTKVIRLSGYKATQANLQFA